MPYAGPKHPRALAATPAHAEWHDVYGDTHAYWRLMRDAWSTCLETGDDLLVIEHDVVFRPDVLEQFDDCPQPWCLFGYLNMCHPECREAWANALGCTRFRNEVIQACPDAVSSIPEPLRNWNYLCDHIAGNKTNGVPCEQTPDGLRGQFSHHWHEPHVEHITRDVDPDFWYGPDGRYPQGSQA